MKKELLIMICSILLIACGGKTMRVNADGKPSLKPCGVRPNCVSSQSSISIHKIEPFIIDSSAIEAIKKLKTIVADMSGATTIEEEDIYLHIEFKSKVFGFVDDVEFLADEKEMKIHVRSASRVGLSDFGVNRRRIETIRVHYQNQK